jgi:hypothetical protein
MGVDKATSSHFMEVIDVDGSGDVSYTEFVASALDLLQVLYSCTVCIHSLWRVRLICCRCIGGVLYTLY